MAGHSNYERQLSPLEMEVLVEMRFGRGRQAIASDLRLSKRKVVTLTKSIYDKLGADNRTSAVMFAIDLGVLQQVEFYGS